MTDNNKWPTEEDLSRPRLCDRLFEMTRGVADWSKDPRRKVGAVIADTEFRVVSLGYNGFPRGVKDESSRLQSVELKNLMTVHAELNALLNASSIDRARGGRLFLTDPPCSACCGAMIQAGVASVLLTREGVHRYEVADSKWAYSWRIGRFMLIEAGVQLFAEGTEA